MKFYVRVLTTRYVGGIYHLLLHMGEESRGKYLPNLYFESLVLIEKFDLSAPESSTYKLNRWTFWTEIVRKTSSLKCPVSNLRVVLIF